MHKQAKHKSIASKNFKFQESAIFITLYNLSVNAKKKKKKADKEKKA